MRIIIVGAGEVGYNIASRLASENKNVIVIDKNIDAIRQIEEALDVQVVLGSGSSPKVLIEAGIKNADILMAVTDSDEINLVACLVTNRLSPKTKKLIRLRNKDFESLHESFKNQIPYIDTIINPETEVVKIIRRLMNVPRAVDVGSFVDDQVHYAGIRMHKNSSIVGTRLIDFPLKFGNDRPLIAAIIRNNEVIVPRGGHKIESEDLIYFISESERLEKTLKIFDIKLKPIQRVLIIGGGQIGTLLAKSLEKDNIKTKIIESNLDRCLELSRQMDKVIVVHGDGSDQKIFLEENVNHADVVVSVTNDDETNVLVSLLAKNLGAADTITRIGKSSYFPLLSTIGIEKVVSTRLSAVSSILQNVREGHVLSDISIFGERGEFIEAIALETSKMTEKPLKKIPFPKGSLLICIIREGQIMIPTGESIINTGDRIILFSIQNAVKKLEKLLTVKLEFL